MDTNAILSGLLTPEVLIDPAALAADPRIIPAQPGIYGWWFSAALPLAPRHNTVIRDGWALLYVGIAPNGARGTSGRRTLRDRMKNHCRGPIRTSTLRRTVAALTVDVLDLSLERSQNGKLTMPLSGEHQLTSWLGQHARVSWATCDAPWAFEKPLIEQGPRLPLNISGSSDPFRRELSALRARLGR